MNGAGLAFLPMISIAVLAFWTLLTGVLGVVFDRKRYRPIPATLNSAAPGGAGLGLGGRANVSVAGPFNEVAFAFAFTSDAHTVDGAGAGGLARAFMELQINSTKCGMVAQMDSMTLYMMSSLYFNTAAYTDQNGAAETMYCLLPLGVDADESVNIAVTFGNAVDMCSTADLGAAGCTAVVVTLSVELLPGNPETYYAYRVQPLGASGVIGVNGIVQQPTPPVVPGYALCKEMYVTETVSRVTACGLALANIRLNQSDDEIINIATPTLQNMNTSHKGFLARNGYVMTEHTPLQNNDATILTLTNGGVATILPSEMLYVYMAGKVTASGSYIQRIAANNPQAANGAPASPSRTQRSEKGRKGVKRLFGRR